MKEWNVWAAMKKLKTTPIEIMVVLAIVSILAVMIVPAIMRARDGVETLTGKSKQQQVKETIQNPNTRMQVVEKFKMNGFDFAILKDSKNESEYLIGTHMGHHPSPAAIGMLKLE